MLLGLTLCSQQTVMAHTIVCLPDLRSTAARKTETGTSLADGSFVLLIMHSICRSRRMQVRR